MRLHTYEVSVQWTGNDGDGTRDYRCYRRDHVIRAGGKPDLPGSSDPAFRGDAARYNPEDLLVASVSACHMLWYLHLCAVNGVTVTAYQDSAYGQMDESDAGIGVFRKLVLRPQVGIAAGSDPGKALALHEEAHRFCFIANAVKFPVQIEPTPVTVAA